MHINKDNRVLPACIMLIVYLIALYFGDDGILALMLVIGFGVFYEMTQLVEKTEKKLDKVKIYTICCILATSFFIGVFYLYQQKNFAVIITLLVGTVSVTDMFSFFVGKSLGMYIPLKLAPKISPNKTWIGFIGGVLNGTAFFTIVSAYLNLEQFSLLFIAVGAFVAAMSVFGDITQSYCKRIAGVKDTGTIFLGHGGFWDRADSHIVAIPVFALISFLVGQWPAM